MYMKKRGQVTIFIIIGIILLFSSALIFYIRNQIATIQQPEMADIVDNVPVSGDPIQTFIRDCLEESSIRGLQMIGEQGGYIDYEAAGLRYNSAKPTKSSLLKLSPQADMYVPFWLEMPASDKCTTDCYIEKRIPPLTKQDGDNSVESQLGNYIESELNVCLDEFNVFTRQGYEIKKAGQPVVDVQIAYDDVYVGLEYPLKFSKQDSDSDYKDFSVRVPLNLRKAFELAKLVVEKQIKMQIFETQALNLIASFSGLSETQLPPLYDFRFGSGTYLSWQKKDVKQKMQNILMNHVPMIQFTGTRNYYRRQLSNPMMQGLTNKMIVFQNQSFAEYNLDFTYLGWWPTYLNVEPSRGEQIRPESMSGGPIASIIPGLGMNQYKFYYDMSFPVLTTITYPEALRGRGFTLTFAMEATIKENTPLNGSVLRGTGSDSGTFFCEEGLRRSGNILIQVYDYSQQKPLDGAVIYFKSGADGCPLGTTGDVTLENGTVITGAIRTRLPLGIGALMVEAEGFGTKSYPYATGLGQSDNVSLVLYPKKKIPIDAKVLPYTAIIEVEDGVPDKKWTYVGTEKDMLSKQKLIVSAEQVVPGGDGHDTVAVMGYNTTANPYIELVPGNYTVDLTLITNTEWTIPEYEDCFPSGFLGLGEDCNTIGPTTMELLMNGGGMMDSKSGLFEVTPDDLYLNDLLTFKVIVSELYDVPENWRRMDDLEALDVFENLSNTYRHDLEPTWS